MSNKARATEIQKFLNWEYGIDLAIFQNSELKRMATEIQKFLDLEVSTDDLHPADELLEDDGYSDEDQEQDEFTDRDERDDY